MASTKAFTAQVAALLAMAVAAGVQRGHIDATREAELVSALAGGMSIKEAAVAMSISEGTARVHLRSIFAKADVPAGPYNTIDDLLEDPHLGDVGFWNFDEHPTEGRIRRTRTPVTFRGGMREEVLPAPRLGAQTAEILAEAGYTADEIATMLQSGAAA